jgi:hypothetical protein
MLKWMFAVAIAAGAFAIPTIKAYAADPGYCERYARRAVAQYERNRSIPGCFHGANRQWHGNFDGHYGWCLRAPYGAVDREVAYRAMRLRGCMARAY